MKKLFGTLLLLGFAVNALAGETWRKETFESGEIVYHSGYWNGFNSQLVLSERGVGFANMSTTGKFTATGFCMISLNGEPEEKCELVPDNLRMFVTGTNLYNRIADAKSVKLKVRFCRPGACLYAVNGGTADEVSWEWDEPLSTTFSDFKPYPVKK